MEEEPGDLMGSWVARDAKPSGGTWVGRVNPGKKSKLEGSEEAFKASKAVKSSGLERETQRMSATRESCCAVIFLSKQNNGRERLSRKNKKLAHVTWKRK